MLISGDTEKNATHKNFNKSNHATANNKIFIVDKLFFMHKLCTKFQAYIPQSCLSSICSRWAQWRRKNTWIRIAKLSINRTHSSTDILLIRPVIALFSSWIVWGLFSYTFFFEIAPEIKIWIVFYMFPFVLNQYTPPLFF